MEEAPSLPEPFGTLPAGKGGITYHRLKETHDIKSVRALAGGYRGGRSYIARVLKTLALAEPIKDYLRTHKNDPVVVKFFHLRVLLDIVRQGEERLQLGRFRELMEEFEEGNLLNR